MDAPDTNPPAAEHVVQFYDDDSVLIATLADYVGGGLGADAACLVIATKDHRDALDERLREAGVDLAAAQAAGRYLAVDAADTLARIEVAGLVDQGRFTETVGALLGRLAAGRPIRVFGEMVGLLLARGQSDTSVRLETLWNELQATRAFDLLCAYPLTDLDEHALAGPIVQICARHSRVVATHAPKRADEEIRLRAVKATLEEQVEDLRRLHEMTVRLTGNLDVESVLRDVLQAALAVPGADSGLLSLCDAERPGLAPAVHTGFDPSFVDEVRHVPTGGGACGCSSRSRGGPRIASCA